MTATATVIALEDSAFGKRHKRCRDGVRCTGPGCKAKRVRYVAPPAETTVSEP